MDNTNKPMGESKNKKLFVILGLVLVVAVIVAAAVMSNKQQVENQNPMDEVVAEATKGNQPYIPEGIATEPAGEVDAEGMDEATTGPDGEIIMEEENLIPEALRDATIAVVGANPIAKDGTVVSTEGVAVKNDVVPMSAEAPKQTAPVSKDQLSESVIQLGVSAAGWDPAEFTVKAGAPVSISITSTDSFTHVFMFDDAALSAVAVGVSPGETRAITFNAPTTPGEYAFHCDVPGHKARGEVGKMIVQ